MCKVQGFASIAAEKSTISRSRGSPRVPSCQWRWPRSTVYCFELLLGKHPDPENDNGKYRGTQEVDTLLTLTKTFQGAIFIARVLGIHYLWIDSLCIIQDDKLDWQEQAALMCDIYRQATLTIAAAKGTDGNAGCFSDRLAAGVRPVRLTFNFPEDNYDNPLLWLPVMELYASKDVSKKNPLDAPSEARVTGTPREGRVARLQNLLFDLGSKPVTTERGIPAPTEILMREGWPSFVFAYYQRQLTYPGDKFPALSGLALAVQKKFKDTYVAGLWKNGLHHELVWYLDTRENPIKQRVHPPEEYVAPSWSWASMKAGNIKWHNNWSVDIGVEPAFEILDVVCVSVGPNPFGEITNGFIKAKGSLKQMQAFMPPGRDHQIPRAARSQTLVATLEFDEPMPELSEIWCLPVLRIVTSFGSKSDMLHAMLLLPTGLGSNEFRRAGIAVVKNGVWFRDVPVVEFKIV